MGRFVDGCWISLVWVCIDVNRHGIAQNGWQEKALTDGACWIFMHTNADVIYMKQGLTTGMIAIRPCSTLLVFSDADPRCCGIG